MNSHFVVSRLQSDSLLHRLSIVWLALLLLASASKIANFKTLQDAIHLVSTLIAKSLLLNQRFFITKKIIQHMDTSQLVPPSFLTATAVGDLFVLFSQLVDRLLIGNKAPQFSSTASFVSIVTRFFEIVMNGIMCYVELAVQGDLADLDSKSSSSSSSSSTTTATTATTATSANANSDSSSSSSASSFFSNLVAPSNANSKSSSTTATTPDKIRKIWDSALLLDETTQVSNPIRMILDTRPLDAMLMNSLGVSSSTMLKYFIAVLRQFRKRGKFRAIMRTVGQMLATQSSLTVAVRSLMTHKSSLFSDDVRLNWERDNILQILFELLSRLSTGDPDVNAGLFSTYRGIVTTAAHVLYTRFLQDSQKSRRRQPRRHPPNKSPPESGSAPSASPIETLLGEAMTEGQ